MRAMISAPAQSFTRKHVRFTYIRTSLSNSFIRFPSAQIELYTGVSFGKLRDGRVEDLPRIHRSTLAPEPENWPLVPALFALSGQ